MFSTILPGLRCRTAIMILTLFGLAHCVNGQSTKQMEDDLLAAQVRDPDSMLLYRVTLSLPMKDDSISEDARRKLDAKMSEADAKIQELHKKVGKDEASEEQFVAAAKKVYESVAKDANLLTKEQQKSLGDRSFVVTGEVMWLQEEPSDFTEHVLKQVKQTDAQKERIEPLLKDAAKELNKLKDRQAAGIATEQDSRRRSRFSRETLLKLHKLLTPEQGMDLITLVMTAAGQTAEPKSQPVHPGR